MTFPDNDEIMSVYVCNQFVSCILARIKGKWMTVCSLHLIVTGTAEERARGVGGVMVL